MKLVTSASPSPRPGALVGGEVFDFAAVSELGLKALDYQSISSLVAAGESAMATLHSAVERARGCVRG